MEILYGERIFELDEEVLKSHPDRSNVVLFSDIFRANPHTSAIGVEGAETVGHLLMLPITDEAYNLLRNGNYNVNERDVEKDIVSFDSDIKECRIFIVSFYLHPDHRTTGNIRALVRAFKELSDGVRVRGIKIKSIMSNAQNEEGVRTATYGGLRFSHNLPNGTKIMEVVFD